MPAEPPVGAHRGLLTSGVVAREVLIERAYYTFSGSSETSDWMELLAGDAAALHPTITIDKFRQNTGDRLTEAIGVSIPIFENASKIVGLLAAP